MEKEHNFNTTKTAKKSAPNEKKKGSVGVFGSGGNVSKGNAHHSGAAGQHNYGNGGHSYNHHGSSHNDYHGGNHHNGYHHHNGHHGNGNRVSLGETIAIIIICLIIFVVIKFFK